jgi:hypothetical protein
MMVGICRTVNSGLDSGWISSTLNNLKVCENVVNWIIYNFCQVFPMHAEDDRYAKFFLFTEAEVEILCETYKRVHGLFAH